MGNWKTVPLGSLGAEDRSAFATGPFGSAVSAKNFQESGVPMIRGSNLSGDVGIRLDESDLVFVSDELVSRFARSVVTPGDLIFTCWGTIGQVGLIDESARYERYIVSNKQMKMSPDRCRVSSLFLYYYLSQASMVSLMKGQSIGSSVPGFNLGQLKKLPITLPPLIEQQAIADVLGALDDKIAVNRRTMEKAGELATASCSRASGRVRLESIASQSRDQVRPDRFDDRLAHYSLPAFDEGVSPAVVSANEIKSNKFLLTRPAVLISKLNPRIPRVWDASTLPQFMAVASTEFVVLEPIGTSSTVLWALLSERAVTSELATKVAGTSGSHQRVTAGDVLALEVRDPALLDFRVKDLITNLGRLIYARRLESSNLAKTRNELLPLLMSGRIRIRDAEKVVEEVV